jgi:FAD/FMN-containing dehydrogenase
MGMRARRLDVTGLAARFRGTLIVPGDPVYDEARRVWNGMIDKHPDVIARCGGVADVIDAVRFAREKELPVAVRGGGHNVAGNAVCDDGIVIDLSPMKGLRVDASAMTARAEPGVVWGEIDRECQAFGLVVPGGIQSTTGIAGFTLGGGIAWLSRRFGHTVDNLLSADIVTWEGHLLTASDDQNEDLFFGVRGGGGNFGIATSFEYRLHPLERVVGGMVWHPLDRAEEVVRFFGEWSMGIPDELSAILFIITAPRAPHVPERLQGRPVVTIGVCYTGEEAEETLRPVREFGPPELDLIAPMPYVELQRLLDAANPPAHQNYWKAEYLRELSDETVATIAEHGSQKPAGLSKVLLTRLGGAASRVPEDAMAFSHRQAPYIININGMGPDPAQTSELVGWTRAFWEAMQPFSYGGVYVNFLGEEGQDRTRAAYGEEKFARLQAIKRGYDPTNFFHLNQNIRL